MLNSYCFTAESMMLLSIKWAPPNPKTSYRLIHGKGVSAGLDAVSWNRTAEKEFKKWVIWQLLEVNSSSKVKKYSSLFYVQTDDLCVIADIQQGSCGQRPKEENCIAGNPEVWLRDQSSWSFWKILLFMLQRKLTLLSNLGTQRLKDHKKIFSEELKYKFLVDWSVEIQSYAILVHCKMYRLFPTNFCTSILYSYILSTNTQIN